MMAISGTVRDGLGLTTTLRRIDTARTSIYEVFNLVIDIRFSHYEQYNRRLLGQRRVLACLKQLKQSRRARRVCIYH